MSENTTRRRMLLAESNLLRLQLAGDFAHLKAAWEPARIPGADRGSSLSATTLLMACLGAVRPFMNPGQGGEGQSRWPGRLFQGLGLLSDLWLAWQRPRSRPD